MANQPGLQAGFKALQQQAKISQACTCASELRLMSMPAERLCFYLKLGTGLCLLQLMLVTSALSLLTHEIKAYIQSAKEVHTG